MLLDSDRPVNPEGHVKVKAPKGGRERLMFPPCLESQGCHLVPLYYLPSCSSAYPHGSFCFVFFCCLLALSPDFFPQKILQHFWLGDRLFGMALVSS